jgi:hypothetical protein
MLFSFLFLFVKKSERQDAFERKINSVHMLMYAHVCISEYNIIVIKFPTQTSIFH